MDSAPDMDANLPDTSPNDRPPARCDVLVIGGGPAGSTAAALLARRGWQVVQIEKEQHPRFHIGESLLPANVPLLEELGVLEQVQAIGVRKLGADFPKGVDRHETFRFERALGDTPPYAFQVRRDQFDHLLFEHAAACGANSFQNLVVESVTDNDDGFEARLRHQDGQERSLRCRYLIDASGRDTVLADHWKLKRKNPRHQSAAIFAHFEGVQRRDGDDAGNISIYRFEHGWAWFIPLPDGVMSIGAVCAPAYLKQRRVPPAQFLLQTLAAMPEAQARLGEARIVGETRVTGNYSYSATRMAGPGWVLVGDAYAFVDPIFSSGVYLAMHSARQAVEVVDASLRDPRREASLQRAFARRIRRGLAVFSWFIYRFNAPVMRLLFGDPRSAFQLDRGVIAMLAGDVFDNRAVRRRLHLFKAVYALTALFNLRRHLGELRWRRAQAALPFDAGVMTREGG